MTVKQASELLGIPQQVIRCRMRTGKLPIGICKKGEKEWSYYIIDDWLYGFLRGDLVTIPEGLSDKWEPVVKEEVKKCERRTSILSVRRRC